MSAPAEQTVGPYRIIRPLGSGNFGETSEALHSMLGSRVCLKRPLAKLRDTANGARAFGDFVTDALKLTALQHPHVAGVIAGSASDQQYLAVELIPGETLAQRLQRRGGRLGEAECVSIARSIALGLAAGHQHVPLHGDLHPGNVMFGPDVRTGGKEVLKLTDFSWGRAAFRFLREGGGGTVTEAFLLGLPGYMAPEQYWGDAIDHKVDTYALGVILFEALAGRRPLEGGGIEVMELHLRRPPPSLARLVPGLPQALVELTHGMLAKAPAQRPPLTQIVAELTRLQAEIEARAGSPGMGTPARAPEAAQPTLQLGRYEISGRLSSEGAVTIFEVAAAPPAPKRRLKVLAHDATTDARLAARFLSSAQGLQRVSHPAVTRISDQGVLPDGRPFLVCDPVEGRPLLGRMAAPVDRAEALHVIGQLAAGLAALHEHGVLYLGLSPTTVVLRTELAAFAGYQPVLLDTEAAQFVERQDVSAWPLSTAALQEPAQIIPYLAPEQHLGGRTLDGKADVYALGVVAYQLITGRHPFAAAQLDQYREKALGEIPKPPRESVLEIDPRLETLILRMLRRDPGERPTSKQVADEAAQLAKPPAGSGAAGSAAKATNAPTEPQPSPAGEAHKRGEPATTRGGTELLPRPPRSTGPPQSFGRYQVVRAISGDDVTAVFEARHRDTGQPAVIKALLQPHSSDPKVAERFIREARALSMNSHDGAVRIFEFNPTGEDTPYLVMEHVAGCPLRQRLAQDGAPPRPLALELGRQLALTLSALHQSGVVHRDVQPDSIILVRTPDGAERTKLIGFKLAKLRMGATAPGGGTQLAVTDIVYAAPEVLAPQGHADERSDVYSLGIVLYEMLSGRPPFSKEAIILRSQRQVAAVPPPPASGIDGKLLMLLTQMVSPVPTERPSMAQVAAVLSELIAPRPRPVALIVGISLLVFTLLLAGIGYLLYERSTVRFIVRSHPSGAEIRSRDGGVLGKTPDTLEVARFKGKVRLSLIKTGYRSEDIELDPSVPSSQRDEEYLLTPTAERTPALGGAQRKTPP